MTDREALAEFTKGATFVLTVMAVTALIIALASHWGDANSPEKFEVVDHYGTCAVVRYYAKDRGESVFFLDCGNQHLEEGR